MSLIPQTVRLKPFASIYNFRDFGAYAGHDGKAVREGVLFRSAHLHNLNDADVAQIDQLPIGAVVDLRHGPERRRQPSKWSGRASVLTLPADHAREEAKVAPHEAFTQTQLNTAADARGYMMDSYAKRPHDAGFQALFRNTLDFMSKPETGEDDGLLVHCAAGKDRTGTLCALIQGLLGVSEDDILHDYMLTMDAVDIDAILGPASAMFTQKYGREIDVEAIRPMFEVEPGFLKQSLDAIEDYDRYAVDTLGLASADLDRLRARYLVN